MDSKNIGIVFFIVGIVLLFFTFYLAYGLYGYLTGSQPIVAASSTAPSAVGANNTITVSGVAQAVASSIIGAIPINRYASIFLGILVLYVLANVSYKIAKLGVEMMRSSGNNGEKPKSK